MPKENNTVELNDKELEKPAGGDEPMVIFEKGFTFKIYSNIYHVCEDTPVYSFDQTVRVYRNVNVYWDTYSFTAGEIMAAGGC